MTQHNPNPHASGAEAREVSGSTTPGLVTGAATDAQTATDPAPEHHPNPGAGRNADGPRVFQKRPVRVDAMPWDGTKEGATAIIYWVTINGGTAALDRRPVPADNHYNRLNYELRLHIQTLEGPMTASPNDWIIQGVKGEFYPCKPDIFAVTYEPVLSL